MIKVSVIIPVFNVEHFIAKTLISICNQTLSNIEIIVINDGSKDNSGAICDRLAETDSRIHVLHQSNQGITKTRNIGMRLAKGDYLCFVDSDDWVSENFINRLIGACERAKADIAFTNHSIVNDNKFSYRDDYHQLIYTAPVEKNKLLCQIFFPAVHGKLYRRSALTKANITFLEQSGYNGFAEDLLFNFEAINTVGKLVFVPDEYYFYNRDNPNSVCSLSSRLEDNNDDRLTVLTKIISEAQKLPYRYEISPILQEILMQHIKWGKKDMAQKFIKSPIAGLENAERDYLLQIAYGITQKKKNWLSRLFDFMH